MFTPSFSGQGPKFKCFDFGGTVMFFSFWRDRKKLKMGIGIFKARNKIKRKVNI